MRISDKARVTPSCVALRLPVALLLVIVASMTASADSMNRPLDKEALGPTRLDLFVSGQDGYTAYRIPALVVSGKGTLLAFCEARKKSFSDKGDILPGLLTGMYVLLLSLQRVHVPFVI